MPKSVFLSRPPNAVPCSPCGPANAAEELAVRREDIHRRPGGHIHAAFRIDGRAVAGLTAAQLSELPLVRQRAVGLHVERDHHRAVRDVERLLVRAQDDAVGPRDAFAVLRDDALRVGVEQPAPVIDR